MVVNVLVVEKCDKEHGVNSGGETMEVTKENYKEQGGELVLVVHVKSVMHVEATHHKEETSGIVTRACKKCTFKCLLRAPTCSRRVGIVEKEVQTNRGWEEEDMDIKGGRGATNG
jgi:hypothetical protein